MVGRSGRRADAKDHGMKVSVVGAGYVGVVTGLCLASTGNRVDCIEKDIGKVKSLNSGKPPFHEDGLGSLLEGNLRKGRFRALQSIMEGRDADVFLICVGTPSRRDGSLDIRNVRSAATDVGRAIRGRGGYPIVVLKSTVPPGTLESVLTHVLERSSGKRSGDGFGLASNPEFLREGNAIEDFLHPDRIVIGTHDDRAFGALSSLYRGIDAPLLRTSPTAAEMIKMASNAFLAARVSLINEIGNVCKGLGVDVREVAEGVGLDRRIGKEFLRAGCGFGGSCFPKDVRGLAAVAREHGIEPRMMDAIVGVNEAQPLRAVELLSRRMGIRGSRICVLGLAFKPGTDDVREAPSLKVVKELLRRGAEVRVHDYQAMDIFRKLVPEAASCRTVEECVRKSDAVLILTEWPGYADPSLYGDKLVIDGRGAVRTSNYEGVCW